MKKKGKRVSDTIECREAQEVASSTPLAFPSFTDDDKKMLRTIGGAFLGALLGMALYKTFVAEQIPATKPTKSRKTVIPKKSRK